MCSDYPKKRQQAHMIGTEHDELTDWFQADGVRFVRSLGIETGWQVLDFGAGIGGYSVPLAQVVGQDGKVFAVDKAPDRLKQIQERLPGDLRGAVQPMPTDGNVHLEALEDDSIDAVFLFDVLQHVDDWRGLFDTVARCLCPGGMLYVNPSELSHPAKVDMNRLHSELARAGFSVLSTREARVVHNDHMSCERIYVCRLEEEPAQDERSG
jgi:ubiquinone/menaquinone biosynthesis C-methylase UbiE